MSRGLPLPLRQFGLGCGIRHVGNLPGCETDFWMQVQGNVQEDSGLFSIGSDVDIVVAEVLS